MRRALAAAALLLGFPAPTIAAAPAVPKLTHVVVVVFENKESADVIGNPDAPAFNAVAAHGAIVTDYTGVSHPSLPNYLALVSGSTHGIVTDCRECVVNAPSLADTLAARGRTWKTYAEGLPSVGFTGADVGTYTKKHNPFTYFPRVTSNPARLRDIVPYTQFARDVRARKLPSFSLVVPDLCNDMHDCPVATGDAWLKRNIVPLLSSRALAGGAVFVVFDEGTTLVGGGGHVAAIAAGPRVRPGARFTAHTNHYGLLRTVESALGLPLLGRSATATPITGIWK